MIQSILATLLRISDLHKFRFLLSFFFCLLHSDSANAARKEKNVQTFASYFLIKYEKQNKVSNKFQETKI